MNIIKYLENRRIIKKCKIPRSSLCTKNGTCLWCRSSYDLFPFYARSVMMIFIALLVNLL
jgi:hypothetical protein